MRHVYTALVYLIRPFALAVVLWRGLRNRQYWDGLGERFGFGDATPAQPALWVHAVSLGEVNAAAPLIRALRSHHPRIPVVLTTATPTGRARARALFGDDAAVRYLPYDTPGSMRRFIARVRPRLVIVMETELWPNLFAECRRREIPILLASARLSPKSARRYRQFGRLFRETVSQGVIAAQTREDADRFIAIGADRGRTHVVGNVKFEADPGAANEPRQAAEWGSRPVWVAGSTHAGEEEVALAAHAALRNLHSAALLLLVPRHPQRFQAVADLLARRAIPFHRRSAGLVPPADAAVVLVDTVGELASLYAGAEAAFVGGSLVPIGGHNLLEPAALGVPVLTGPYQANARDVAALLRQEGAALEVVDEASLAAALRLLFADPGLRRRMGEAGRRVVRANRGTVARLCVLIDAMIEGAA